MLPCLAAVPWEQRCAIFLPHLFGLFQRTSCRFFCVSPFLVISIAPLDYFSHLFTISSSTRGKCQYHCPLGRYARALADFGMCCRLDEHTARHFGHRGLCFRRLGRVEALVWNLVLKNLGRLYLPFSTCPDGLVSDFGQEALRDYDEALRASLGGKEVAIAHTICLLCVVPPVQFNPPLLLGRFLIGSSRV